METPVMMQIIKDMNTIVYEKSKNLSFENNKDVGIISNEVISGAKTVYDLIASGITSRGGLDLFAHLNKKQIEHAESIIATIESVRRNIDRVWVYGVSVNYSTRWFLSKEEARKVYLDSVKEFSQNEFPKKTRFEVNFCKDKVALDELKEYKIDDSNISMESKNTESAIKEDVLKNYVEIDIDSSKIFDLLSEKSKSNIVEQVEYLKEKEDDERFKLVYLGASLVLDYLKENKIKESTILEYLLSQDEDTLERFKRHLAEYKKEISSEGKVKVFSIKCTSKDDRKETIVLLESDVEEALIQASIDSIEGYYKYAQVDLWTYEMTLEELEEKIGVEKVKLFKKHFPDRIIKS